MSIALQPTEAVRLVLERARTVGWSPLNRTQITKLLYFIDLQAVQDLGHPATVIEWRWDKFGPFSADIYRGIDALTERHVIRSLPLEAEVAWPEYRYVLSEDEMSDHAEAAPVFDHVIAAHQGESAAELRDTSYRTAPMLRVQLHGARGDDLDLFADTPYEREAMQYLADSRMPDEFRADEALHVLATQPDERD